MRKRRRSVGKSNKLGCRFTAEMRAALICDMNFWALICRSNRQNAHPDKEVATASIRVPMPVPMPKEMVHQLYYTETKRCRTCNDGLRGGCSSCIFYK